MLNLRVWVQNQCKSFKLGYEAKVRVQIRVSRQGYSGLGLQNGRFQN